MLKMASVLLARLFILLIYRITMQQFVESRNRDSTRSHYLSAQTEADVDVVELTTPPWELKALWARKERLEQQNGSMSKENYLFGLMVHLLYP